MRLEVSQVAVVNAQLGVGGVTESVNVSAESPLLETSKADRGTVIDQARIAELPLQSRSPMALATLVAGVTYNAQAIYLRPFDNGALADWSMNGGQNRNNEFLLDGAPNNANQGGNNIAYVPPADAVQEFKMQTNSYDAQYGRTAGGVVNMSLKSGTNSFHGTAYEYYRRKWLDANSFLLNARSTPKVEHYLDQYGFEVDGPVKIPGLYNGTNKTFFMFNGEKYREGTPAAQFSTVPTAAMKNGDFSNLVDAQRQPDHHLRSGHRPRRQRRVDARSVPRQHHSCRPHRPCREGAAAVLPAPNCTTPGVAPTGSRTSATTSTSTRTCSGTGSARSTTTSARTTACSSATGRTRGTRFGTRPRSAAARPKWVSYRSSATTMRSSATGCISLAAARCSTCAAATRITSRAARARRISASIPLRSAGLRVSSRSSRPRKSADVPGLHIRRVRAARSRDSGRTTNKIYTIQPNITMTRGNHNIRSGLDTRSTNVYSTNYGNAGGQIDFTRQFTRSTLNSTSTTEGNAWASLLLGAPSRRQRAGESVPPLSVDLHRPVDPGRLADQQQVDGEPRVPLGLQQPGQRGAGSVELHLRSVDPEPDRFESRASRWRAA